HQKLMLQHFSWPDDQIPSICNACENCQHRIKEKPELINVKADVIHLVEIVADLVKKIEVDREDVIGTFLQLKNQKIKQKKYLIYQFMSKNSIEVKTM